MLLNISLLIQWQNKYPLLNEEEFMVGWGLWGGRNEAMYYIAMEREIWGVSTRTKQHLRMFLRIRLEIFIEEMANRVNHFV
jgi:hypothetical protein